MFLFFPISYSSKIVVRFRNSGEERIRTSFYIYCHGRNPSVREASRLLLPLGVRYDNTYEYDPQATCGEVSMCMSLVLLSWYIKDSDKKFGKMYPSIDISKYFIDISLIFRFSFSFFILSIFLGETYFTNFILFFGLLNKLILIILFLHLILFTAKKYKNIVFLTYLYIYIYIIYLMSLNTFKLKWLILLILNIF